MTITLSKRRIFVGAIGLAVALLAAGLLARQVLTGLVVNAMLHLAGASEIKFTVTAASPWRVVVEDIGFSVRTQGFTAQRVTFTRAHWSSGML